MTSNPIDAHVLLGAATRARGEAVWGTGVHGGSPNSFLLGVATLLASPLM